MENYLVRFRWSEDERDLVEDKLDNEIDIKESEGDESDVLRYFRIMDWYWGNIWWRK